MNEGIIKFIEKQRVATVCCVDEDGSPYCFSCFYVFDKSAYFLYFKTSPSSHHSSLLEKNAAVAGTIQPDKLNPLAIKGIQYKGVVLDSDHMKSNMAKAFYHYRFPFATVMHGDVRIIELTEIKMTDNSAGFGKKILWKKEEEDICENVADMKMKPAAESNN
jgi:uncharacterized protein YhbP (UPF0306 family)